jgi:hypothetical protein
MLQEEIASLKVRKATGSSSIFPSSPVMMAPLSSRDLLTPLQPPSFHANDYYNVVK